MVLTKLDHMEVKIEAFDMEVKIEEHTIETELWKLLEKSHLNEMKDTHLLSTFLSQQLRILLHCHSNNDLLRFESTMTGALLLTPRAQRYLLVH